jgi:hypothetical protein
MGKTVIRPYAQISSAPVRGILVILSYNFLSTQIAASWRRRGNRRGAARPFRPGGRVPAAARREEGTSGDGNKLRAAAATSCGRQWQLAAGGGDGQLHISCKVMLQL